MNNHKVTRNSISKITIFRLNPKKFHNFSFEPKIAIFEGKSQKL